MTLIFDIGKTNKKALVFDDDYQVVWSEQIQFDEVADMDGEPTDDMSQIVAWMRQILSNWTPSFGVDRRIKNLKIDRVNVATYGATLAHLDKSGQLLAQPFNYLKKIESYPTLSASPTQNLKQRFLTENGGAQPFCTATASPDLEHLLNAGFQLYWLKKERPDFFAHIKTSLHLPQYLSYALTGHLASEFTSIGCHTMLWDFEQKAYARWVNEQGIAPLLPPIQAIDKTYGLLNYAAENEYRGAFIRVGIGIHDSSAALLPHLNREKEPFLLLSTGTWSICLNPFNTAPLSMSEFEQDCLFYMRPDGQPVKAARLFLGKIHDEAVEALTERFHQKTAAIRELRFDGAIFAKILSNPKDSLKEEREGISSENAENVSEAYHILMYSLIQQQVAKIHLAAGSTPFKKILVDGGFAKNPIYIAILRHFLPTIKIEPSDMPQGTALGAALAVNGASIIDF
jgi:sugar (pentulose or hexulose) kinase